MVFQPHVVDVGRHVELRMRRVFPVSWEAGLRESYQKALEKYQQQVELERQLWQTMTEASVLRNRIDILNWLRLNLDELTKALSAGDVAGASSLIEQLKAEVERRKAKEEALYQERASKLPEQPKTYTVGSSIIYTPSSTATTTQQTTTTTSQPVYRYGQAYVTEKGGVIREVVVENKVTGYEAVNPQGQGISTAYWSEAVKWANQTPTQPASLFGGNRFYNPFRF